VQRLFLCKGSFRAKALFVSFVTKRGKRVNLAEKESKLCCFVQLNLLKYFSKPVNLIISPLKGDSCQVMSRMGVLICRSTIERHFLCTEFPGILKPGQYAFSKLFCLVISC